MRQRILGSLERIARGIALARGIPEDRAPIVRPSDTEVTPALYNDPAMTERVVGALQKSLGSDNVLEGPREMVSEDFGRFGLEDRQIPVCMLRIGAIDAARIAKSKESGSPLPSLHSSLFWPAPEATIRTGVKALTVAVLDLMK